jgi:D-alanyl-D-alanine carboxypeptidase/D-alanyl-D-alanine-endopeptidase (penicillin-binding protein 4)
VFDPGLFTGHTFAALLAEHTSSESLPVVRGRVATEAQVLAENESPPLVEILDQGLAYSNNLIAEQVLRTTAWRMTGRPGSWDVGKDILQQYWLALGCNPDHFVPTNGSGLGREARLSAMGIVELILAAYRSARPGAGLLDILPVAGEPGTLRSRLRRSGARVRAKTGTLDGVSGLSGVITSEAGQPQVAFGILINVVDSQVFYASRRRKIEDQIVKTVLDCVDEFESLRKSGQSGSG